jgi:predicted amino acid-binding ACT domain protein
MTFAKITSPQNCDSYDNITEGVRTVFDSLFHMFCLVGCDKAVVGICLIENEFSCAFCHAT